MNQTPSRPEWQQRVIEEKAALDEKIAKLEAFFHSDTFKSDAVSYIEVGRLERQLAAMRGYSGVLGERIEAFDH